MKFAFDYALAVLDDNKLCLYDISKMERQIKEKAKMASLNSQTRTRKFMCAKK